MAIKIKAYANCDDVTIVWRLDKKIAGCRGFAVEKEVKGKSGTQTLDTWVGFQGQAHKSGEHRPSTVWPVQRCVWSDYFVKIGEQVRYRVIPMVGPAKALKPGTGAAGPSPWSAWVTVGTGHDAGLSAYFNRGLVQSQWLARQKPTKASLKQNIENPKSPIRRFLGGELRAALLDWLAQAKKDKVRIYAALYELNDPELIEALKAIGTRCSLILASGAFKSGEPDENEAVREDLRLNSQVNIYDRLVKSPHFAHNKFVVICDRNGDPQKLWTGSTNWTVTGICTQVNNGLMIDNAKLAQAYRERWEELKDAGAQYPASLSESGSTPAKAKMGGAAITAWNAPVDNFVDLDHAKEMIDGAREGVLFLMFNPGPANTLLNSILGLDPTSLFIHGVVNQDPGGKKAPLIKFTHKGKQLPERTLRAVLPSGVQKSNSYFAKTFTYNMVMIHSKVVVIDPFGKHPVVMTGSHNLGPKASSKNDDNLVIIENAPGLAAEYAVNIMGIYGHYKWLYNQSLKNDKGVSDAKAKAIAPTYDGNHDDDTWQDYQLSPGQMREIDFWGV